MPKWGKTFWSMALLGLLAFLERAANVSENPSKTTGEFSRWPAALSKSGLSAKFLSDLSAKKSRLSFNIWVVGQIGGLLKKNISLIINIFALGIFSIRSLWVVWCKLSTIFTTGWRYRWLHLLAVRKTKGKIFGNVCYSFWACNQVLLWLHAVFFIRDKGTPQLVMSPIFFWNLTSLVSYTVSSFSWL